MLDLNTIFGMREQMLPQEGFIGFLLRHWLVIAIVLMVLGFVIDQVLYIVRYRPQDRWMRIYRQGKNLVLGWMGKEIPSGAETEEPESAEVQKTVDVHKPEKPVIDEDAPVIRRGGARYAPSVPHKEEKAMPQPEMDEDAPVIVRASEIRRRQDPDTQR